MNTIVNYFFELGFYPDQNDDFHLGKNDTNEFFLKTLWEALVYVLLTLGIFCQEILKFNPLRADLSNISWLNLLAAFIVAAIPFPAIIRKLSKTKPKGGVMHIAIPFAYGLTFNYLVNFVKTP
jgi:hypothetical protein